MKKHSPQKASVTKDKNLVELQITNKMIFSSLITFLSTSVSHWLKKPDMGQKVNPKI